MNVHQAILNVGGQSIELAKEVAKDYIRLSADAIISNISCVHEATISLESDRGTFIVRDLVERELLRIDPFHRFTNEFYTRITKSELDVLEIGSRQREKTATSFEFAGNVKSYLGLDIIAGPNVDIVGDAHQLASLVGDRSFDLVYSQWVFEHLALPWIVVSEINKVLRLGGEVVTLTNQSIGLHDLPWDFWRYSESAWRSLFNVDTGFELLETGLGEPVKITPNRYHFGFREHEGGTGFQASFARARKVCDRAPHWNVDPTTVLSSLSRPYPKELTD